MSFKIEVDSQTNDLTNAKETTLVPTTVNQIKNIDIYQHEHFEDTDNSEEELEPEELANCSPAEKILLASKNGNLDEVNFLLSTDAHLANVKDSDQYTPLHRASYSNHADIVKILLNSGALVNARTVDGWTPLHSASKWNNYKCVSLLIDAGSDVNAQTNSGQTALHLASTNNQAKESLQILLLNKCVNPSKTNSIGETAKQIAIRSGPLSYMFNCDDPVLIPMVSDK